MTITDALTQPASTIGYLVTRSDGITNADTVSLRDGGSQLRDAIDEGLTWRGLPFGGFSFRRKGATASTRYEAIDPDAPAAERYLHTLPDGKGEWRTINTLSHEEMQRLLTRAMEQPRRQQRTLAGGTIVVLAGRRQMLRFEPVREQNSTP